VSVLIDRFDRMNRLSPAVLVIDPQDFTKRTRGYVR
jgi:hypothetical protein